MNLDVVKFNLSSSNRECQFIENNFLYSAVSTKYHNISFYFIENQLFLWNLILKAHIQFAMIISNIVSNILQINNSTLLVMWII